MLSPLDGPCFVQVRGRPTLSESQSWKRVGGEEVDRKRKSGVEGTQEERREGKPVSM